jgi:hypothetical protein
VLPKVRYIIKFYSSTMSMSDPKPSNSAFADPVLPGVLRNFLNYPAACRTSDDIKHAFWAFRIDVYQTFDAFYMIFQHPYHCCA